MNQETGGSGTSGGSRSNDLVEPEGVNAASREIVDEHDSGDGDVTTGGSPDRAEEQISARSPAEEMVGTPSDRDDSPGQELSVGEG